MNITGDPNLNGANGWSVWGKHVLEELKRLNSAQEHIEKQVTKIHIEIATLKVKSGVWGLVGGAIPVVLGVAYVILRKI